MSMMQSAIANQRPSFRPRFRRIVPWGFLVHTMGRGIYKHSNPFEWALRRYRKRGSVHYAISLDGTIFQLLKDNRRGAHVGISRKERAKYLSGEWVNDFNPDAIELWRERHPGYKSPQHLYPGTSPNGCYVGVELQPLERSREDGLYFTDAQHESVADLGKDLARRHYWPGNWMETPRLVGHEAVDAYGRWETAYTNMPWDPGALRFSPRFDWDKVLS